MSGRRIGEKIWKFISFYFPNTVYDGKYGKTNKFIHFYYSFKWKKRQKVKDGNEKKWWKHKKEKKNNIKITFVIPQIHQPHWTAPPQGCRWVVLLNLGQHQHSSYPITALSSNIYINFGYFSSSLGIIKHIYFAFIDCVLLAAGGNYSPHIVGGTAIGKICIIHNDTRYIQVSLKRFFCLNIFTFFFI